MSAPNTGYKSHSDAVLDKNGLPVYGIDLELMQKQAAKHDPEKEATVRSWIEQVAGTSLQGSLEDALKDGVALCNLMNKLKPNSVSKINKNKMPFMQMENIGNALKAMEQVGLKKHDSFQTVDLFEGKNMPQVINSLYMLASLAQKIPGYNGPKVGLKVADKQEINWTEEQLRQARNTTSAQTAGSVKTGLEFQRSISREVVKTGEVGDKNSVTFMSTGSVKTGLESQRSISREVVKTSNTGTNEPSAQTAGSVKTGMELGSQRSISNEVVKVKDVGDKNSVTQQNTGTIKTGLELGSQRSISNEVVKLPQEHNSIADLEKLAELRAKGILTEAEFQAKKKQLLGL